MADRTSCVGLNVHKESIVVAVASGGLPGEVREYGPIANTATALDRLLHASWAATARPCDFATRRDRAVVAFNVSPVGPGTGYVMVAPSLIPKPAGDRVKTDRRDAASLAKLHPAGELTAGVGSG